VFSHPNHEIAVLGLIERFKPHMIFLTDGGGCERVAATRNALATYVAPERLHFLNYSEQAFYEALLDLNVPFFLAVAEDIRRLLPQTIPSEIFCDAVEFYNPTHDLTLPLVWNAIGDLAPTIFEVPLIYQASPTPNDLLLQRIPDAFESEIVRFELSEAETARKTATLLGNFYPTLFASLGERILASVPVQGRTENFMRARQSLPAPPRGQVNRYDRRGLEALHAGLVARAISYEKHYVPVYRGLVAQ
jgi:hypothetical protein